MFGQEQAKAAATAMGVRFVSGEAVKTPDVDGYRAHFAFDDITKITFNPSQAASAGMASGDKTPSEPPFSFGFAKTGTRSVLTINTAPPKAGRRPDFRRCLAGDRPNRTPRRWR